MQSDTMIMAYQKIYPTRNLDARLQYEWSSRCQLVNSFSHRPSTLTAHYSLCRLLHRLLGDAGISVALNFVYNFGRNVTDKWTFFIEYDAWWSFGISHKLLNGIDMLTIRSFTSLLWGLLETHIGLRWKKWNIIELNNVCYRPFESWTSLSPITFAHLITSSSLSPFHSLLQLIWNPPLSRSLVICPLLSFGELLISHTPFYKR